MLVLCYLLSVFCFFFQINAQNKLNGNTAIHYAVLSNNEEIVDLLLEKNCNPNINNKTNQYPKDIAFQKQSEHGKENLNGDNKNRILELLNDAEYHQLGVNNLSAHMSNYTRDELQLCGAGSNDLPINFVLEKQATIKTNPRPTMVILHTLHHETQFLPDLADFLEKKRHAKPFIYQKRWVIVAKPYILWSKNQIEIEELSLNVDLCFFVFFSLFAKDKHLLHTYIHTNYSGNDAEARAKFNGSINILTIQKVCKKQVTTALKDETKDKRSRSRSRSKSKSKKKNNKVKSSDETDDNLEDVKKFVIAARDKNSNQDRKYVFKCGSQEMRDRWVEGLLTYVKYFAEMQDLLVD